MINLRLIELGFICWTIENNYVMTLVKNKVEEEKTQIPTEYLNINPPKYDGITGYSDRFQEERNE